MSKSIKNSDKLNIKKNFVNKNNFLLISNKIISYLIKIISKN